MLKHRNRDGETVYFDEVQDTGAVDVVVDGIVHHSLPTRSVMVTGQADLVRLTDYEPGTVAYTAGFKAMWQKNAAGEWVSM